MLSDTHPEAERVQLDLIRQMTIAERLARAGEWTRMVVKLSRQELARTHPGLDKRELDLLWVEQQYGMDLATRLRKYLEERSSCQEIKATTR
jgi:hypothetical protein